jgi:Gpi18-like mannosyltransferase
VKEQEKQQGSRLKSVISFLILTADCNIRRDLYILGKKMHKISNKKFVLVALILFIVSISLVFSGCSPSQNSFDVQLLKENSESEGMFNYESLTEMDNDWDFQTDGANSSTFSTGPNGLTINTTSSGYGLVSQKVLLKSFSYFKVEYDFNITQMSSFDENSSYHPGLFVGFLEDPLFNVTGDKKAQETFVQQNGKRVFYIKTSGSREYNISINLGTEQYPVKAIATISNLTLVRVSEAVAVEGSNNGFDIFELRPSIFGQSRQSNSTFVLLGGIGTLLLAYIFYVIRSRDMAYSNIQSPNKFYNKIKKSRFVAPTIVILCAFFARLVIILVESLIAGSSRITETYFGYFLENLSAQGTWIAKYGTPYFYQYNSNIFFPIPLYLSALSGLIGQGLYSINGVDASTVAFSVVTINKIFAIIFDLVSVYFIYKLVDKFQGKTAATIMAIFWGLLPILFSMSAGWGAIESLSTMLIIITFYFILSKKYLPSVTAFFLACMTSPFVVYLAPMVLLYTVFLIVESIKNKKWKSLLTPGLTILFSFILFYLITLPFNIVQIGEGDTFVAFDKYIDILKGPDLYSINAFNFQAMLKNNFVEVTVQSKVVDIIFIVFILIVFAFVYFKTRNRLNLTILSSGLIATIWTFSNNMRPETLILSLPLLFMVAVILKEVRLYIVFALYSAFVFTNNSYVYLIAGYDSNGVAQISYSNNAILYVFGAFSLVLIVIYIIVAYDVIVNKKVVLQKPINTKYGVYISRISKNILISFSNFYKISLAWLKELSFAIKDDILESKAKRIEKKKDSIRDKDSYNEKEENIAEEEEKQPDDDN